MTRDDIIRMAAEVWNSGSYFPIPSSDDIERFAAIVAAAEREACAMVCEEVTASWTEWQHNEACMACAKAIRGRGDA